MTLSTAVLITPLVSVFALRIYDTELIRQTETELIAQAAFVQGAYRQAYARCLVTQDIDPTTAGIAAKRLIDVEVSPDGSRRFRPVPPVLDMRTSAILPPSPDPEAATRDSADICGLSAGRDIAELLVEAQEVTLSGIRITDASGTIVGSTRREDIGLVWRTEEVQKSLDGNVVRQARARVSESPDPALDSLSRRGAVRLFVGFPVWNQDRIIGTVVVSRTPVSLQKALYTNRALFAGLLGLVALVSLALSMLASWAIGRPVRSLIQQIRAIESGQPAVELKSPGTAEFEELSRAVAQMDAALRERNAYVLNFARNVSHEFKTPLTSIQARSNCCKSTTACLPKSERVFWQTSPRCRAPRPARHTPS
ncbi:MAG: hypothetical protein R3E66_08840 [bacterium]